MSNVKNGKPRRAEPVGVSFARPAKRVKAKGVPIRPGRLAPITVGKSKVRRPAPVAAGKATSGSRPAPIAVGKLTGRANAITRGNGKKIGLIKTAGSRGTTSPVETFGGQFNRNRPSPASGQADGGFRSPGASLSGSPIPQADGGFRSPGKRKPLPVASGMRKRSS
jgi:hypothetical protein